MIVLTKNKAKKVSYCIANNLPILVSNTDIGSQPFFSRHPVIGILFQATLDAKFPTNQQTASN